MMCRLNRKSAWLYSAVTGDLLLIQFSVNTQMETSIKYEYIEIAREMLSQIFKL